MTSSSTRLRALDLLPPVLAVLFGLLWGIAEAGRAVPAIADRGLLPEVWWWLGGFVVAIATCRRLPWVAIGLLVLIPTLQAIRVFSPPGDTSWPIYGATLYVAFMIGLSARRATSWSVLAAGAVQVVLLAWLVAGAGEWVFWTGMAQEMIDRPFREIRLQAMISVAVTGALSVVVAWGSGFLITTYRRRAAAAAALATAETELREAELELRTIAERSVIAQSPGTHGGADGVAGSASRGCGSARSSRAAGSPPNGMGRTSS